MKFYSDKDYIKKDVKLSPLINRGRRNKIIKFITYADAIALSVTLTISLSAMERIIKPILSPSPFDGREVKIDSVKTDERIKEVYKTLNPNLTTEEIIEYIEKVDDIESKKRLLLLDALNQNKNFNDEDLREFAGYLEYLKDNKYIDYEKTYKILKNVGLYKDVKLGPGKAGVYNPTLNNVYLEDYSSLTHELFHAEHSYIYTKYSWFEEGFTEVLNYEYCKESSYSYPVECAAIRIFTDFIGTDNMFKIRSYNDFNILFEGMKSKGVDEEIIKKTFNLLEEHKIKYLEYCAHATELLDIDLKNLETQIAKNFIYMYNIVYNTPDKISSIFVENLFSIVDRKTPDINFLTFNSLNKERLKYPVSKKKDEEVVFSNNIIKIAHTYRIYKDTDEYMNYEYDDGLVETVNFGSYTQYDLNREFMNKEILIAQSKRR